MSARYPLSWPSGWKRGPRGGKRHGRFTKHGKQLTVSPAIDRLLSSLSMLGAKSVLISSNIELGARGFPLSGRPEPDDRGVAVYFKIGGKDRVLACDTFTTVADNIGGIAGHVEAMRAMDRYGVGTLDQAFAGYDALPPPGASNRPPWRKVLGIAEGVVITNRIVNKFYRDRARLLHPDLPGGSHEAMAQLNEARAAAMKEITI